MKKTISTQNAMYTEVDLVSFGNYLLSDQRMSDYAGAQSAENYISNVNKVGDGDLDNWKRKNRCTEREVVDNQ